MLMIQYDNHDLRYTVHPGQSIEGILFFPMWVGFCRILFYCIYLQHVYTKWTSMLDIHMYRYIYNKHIIYMNICVSVCMLKKYTCVYVMVYHWVETSATKIRPQKWYSASAYTLSVYSRSRILSDIPHHDLCQSAEAHGMLLCGARVCVCVCVCECAVGVWGIWILTFQIHIA